MDVSERPLRVLVVEDEPLVAIQIERLVEQAGGEVVASVETATEALATAAFVDVDLAVMDIDLKGGIDGITAASTLGQRHGVLSAIVSGNPDPAVQAKAAEVAPFGFIPKPFDPDRLRDVFASARKARV